MGRLSVEGWLPAVDPFTIISDLDDLLSWNAADATNDMLLILLMLSSYWSLLSRRICSKDSGSKLTLALPLPKPDRTRLPILRLSRKVLPLNVF